MKKDSGKAGFVFPIMMIMFVIVIVIFTMRMKIVSAAKIQVEDAITDATLAAAVVNTESYGSTYTIENEDYTDMYNKFCKTLKTGLNLDDNFNPKNDTYLASVVKVEEFWVYNVVKDATGSIVRINLEKYYSGGFCVDTRTEYTTDLDSIKTPNGADIESLTVYSKISFDVEGMPGMKVHVSKDQSVDVVSNY